MKLLASIAHRNWALCLCLFLIAQFASASNIAPTVQTIYVIPSSHWDLGFLRTPDGEREEMKPHLDAVISACEADPEFRWTIESGWQLQAWLDRTKDPMQIRRMAHLLQTGQIELSAAYGSMHTEFMGSEDLNRLVLDGIGLFHRFGVSPEVAFVNDVPGLSLRLPQVLARSSVHYVMTGFNTGLGGGANLWPGKVPFDWASPDGSKVLTWQTQGKNGGYTEGMADYYLDPSAEDPYAHTRFYPKEWAGLSELEIMQRGVDKLLKEYTEAGYRKSAVAVLYMHDGIGPDYELKGLLPNVRAWNRAGKQPRIVVATPSEFFHHLEAHDLRDVPLYQGDWSSLWPEVKVNSPAMSADARFLQEHLPETETLWSLLKIEGLATGYPSAQLESAYGALFQYDEHNGSGQGGWPKVLSEQEVREENKEYADGLTDAHHSAGALFENALADLGSSGDAHSTRRVLLVYNPKSWVASRQVTVPALDGAWSVRDASTGALVLSQRLASGDICFEARDLPPLGYRTYWLENRASDEEPAKTTPSALESPYFKVEFDAVTGAIVRITDLRNHRVMLDQKDGGHAGALMLNSQLVTAGDSVRGVTLHREHGSVVDQLIVTRPNSLWPKTIISLPQQEPVVRITEVLDRSKMRFVDFKGPRDMYSFAFDFTFNGKVQRWVENGEGLYRFPQDLLPGAQQEAVVPRHTLVWSEEGDTESYHVMLAEKQTFFNRYRGRSAESTDAHSTEGVEVDAMIKNDQAETRDHGITTFSTYEPGYPSTYTFSFALTGDVGKADPVSAHRFEVQDESAIVELPKDKRPERFTQSFLSVSAPNVVVGVLKPSHDGQPGSYILRLQEIAGKPTDLRVTSRWAMSPMDETTLTEDHILRTGIEPNSIHIGPYQTLTLRLSAVKQVGTASGAKH